MLSWSLAAPEHDLISLSLAQHSHGVPGLALGGLDPSSSGTSSGFLTWGWGHRKLCRSHSSKGAHSASASPPEGGREVWGKRNGAWGLASATSLFSIATSTCSGPAAQDNLPTLRHGRGPWAQQTLLEPRATSPAPLHPLRRPHALVLSFLPSSFPHS